MLWNIINLIYRWNNIRRWNNYPRVQDIVENEHIALKLHIAYITTRILQEKWKNINLLYIFKNIFISSFFTFIYSDIKYDVKFHLRENYKKIYNKLREQLANFFVDLDLPTNIENDFKLIFSSKIENKLFVQDFDIENDIISFVKFFEINMELKVNSKVYPDIYSEIVNNSKSKYLEIWEKIWISEFDLLEKYILNLMKLKFSYRWNRTKRDYPVSVLSHLFLVFSFSYILASLKNFDEKDFEKILIKSLLHDVPEAFTWDVITPTKKSVQWFSKALEEIEVSLVEKNILKDFEKYNFKNELKIAMLEPFSDEIWKVAKLADHLSAMFEAKIENTENYFKVYKNIKKYLWLKEDKQLDYILKYWVDSFDEDVEEKWKKFIWII